MTITREIDGKKYTFPLSVAERLAAYREQQEVFAREDMEAVIEDLEAEELEELGIVPQEALSHLDALADKYLKAQNTLYSTDIDYTAVAWNVLKDYFAPGK